MSTLFADHGRVINSQEPLPIPVELMTKLWENENPTSAFSAQDITLASDDYDFLLLICRFSLTYDRELSFIVEKGRNEFINTGSTGSGGAIGIWRDFNRVNDTKYSVSNAYYAMGATAQTNNDTNLIPQRIYGFKKQVPMQSGSEPESIDITAADFSDTVADFIVSGGKKYGNVVCFTAYGTVSGEYGRIGYIKAELRPKFNMLATACITVGGYQIPTFATINKTDGAIYIVNKGNSNQSTSVSVTYVI